MRLLSIVIIVLFSAPALAAPAADLWDRWLPETTFTTNQPDHQGWDRFLKRHVFTGDDGVNRVNYAAIQREGLADLDAYLDHLATIRPTALSNEVAKAYWINLYNALTLKVVAEHYPISSIRQIDISPGFFTSGPWGAKLFTVEGIEVSLDEIEHRILRPIWNDPRIHYGVNCASIGCPNLRREAYVAARLEAQLDAAAHDFINHPRAARVVDGELIVSSIYEWFQADFGGTETGVISHLRRYGQAPLRSVIMERSVYDDDRYDWSLNDYRESR